jgi:hypothetical protein
MEYLHQLHPHSQQNNNYPLQPLKLKHKKKNTLRHVIRQKHLKPKKIKIKIGVYELLPLL